MDLDPEGETPAPADLVEAGQVIVVGGPPAPAEPEVERAPPSAGEGEAVVKGPDVGARRAAKHRVEPWSSSRWFAHRSAQRPIDDTSEQPQHPTPRLSSMEDVGEATILLARARSSRIKEEMAQQSHAGILDMVLVSVLQIVNGALALRAAMSHSGKVLAHSQGRVNKYKKQCQVLSEKLTRQQEEAKAREEDLGGRVKEVESRAEIKSGRASMVETKLALISARLEVARVRIKELVCQLQHLEGHADAAGDEARATTERATAAEMAAVEACHERAGVVAHAHEASARAEEAKSRDWEAEAQAREAEARAENVVANFKASAEFEQEVIEASLDAYAKVFDLCKVKVSASFNINSSDLEKIQPRDLGGEESREEEAREEPGPSGP